MCILNLPLYDVNSMDFIFQLEIDKMYEVVQTNSNGLYRCRYGDIIKVVGFKNRTPQYEFMYR